MQHAHFLVVPQRDAVEDGCEMWRSLELRPLDGIDAHLTRLAVLRGDEQHDLAICGMEHLPCLPFSAQWRYYSSSARRLAS